MLSRIIFRNSRFHTDPVSHILKSADPSQSKFFNEGKKNRRFGARSKSKIWQKWNLLGGLGHLYKISPNKLFADKFAKN